MQAPSLTCVLFVNTERRGWHEMLTNIFQDITGKDLAYFIDIQKGLMYLHGEHDPLMFIKKLNKARPYALLDRIDYGHEDNPEGNRKPNSNFMRCTFQLDLLEEKCYKKIIEALKIIQGVSFTIDAPTKMGYICGNVEIRVLMKMAKKTGIELLTIDNVVENKEDANLKTSPKKPEAPAHGTETKPPIDTTPPPPPPPPPSSEVVGKSTHHQVTYKKPRGFRRFFSF